MSNVSGITGGNFNTNLDYTNNGIATTNLTKIATKETIDANNAIKNNIEEIENFN